MKEILKAVIILVLIAINSWIWYDVGAAAKKVKEHKENVIDMNGKYVWGKNLSQSDALLNVFPNKEPESEYVFDAAKIKKEQMYIENDGRIGFSSPEKTRKMEEKRQRKIEALPKVGESNPGSDWVYLGRGVLKNVNDMPGYDWRNRKTGEEISGISAWPPDRQSRLVMAPESEKEIITEVERQIKEQTKKEK